MTLKDKLLRIWRGDPEPGLDADDLEAANRPLSRHDLDTIADSYNENEPSETPRIPPFGGPRL